MLIGHYICLDGKKWTVEMAHRIILFIPKGLVLFYLLSISACNAFVN